MMEICWWKYVKRTKIDTSYLKYMPVKGGHTIIQVDKDAQNSIILYGGTNQMRLPGSLLIRFSVISRREIILYYRTK